jgi:hypothetical protein
MEESKTGNFRTEVCEPDVELIHEVLEEQLLEGFVLQSSFHESGDIFLIFKRSGVIHVKACEHCGTEFQSNRADSKTCSVNCRVAMSRAKKKQTQSSPSTDKKAPKRVKKTK